MDIKFNKDTNSFHIYDKHGNYISYFYKKYDKRVMKILQELINQLPVEFNDFKLICKVLNIELQFDVPYYFLNQHLIRQKIIDIFGVLHV